MGLQINTIQMEIGVRIPKTITIYPLSMADEIRLTNTLTATFQDFQLIQKKDKAERILSSGADGTLLGVPNPDDPDFMEKMMAKLDEDEDDSISPKAIGFIVVAIQDNLLDILKMVCEEEVTLGDLTNEQFADLCSTIFDMNFTGVVGKFQSLLGKIKSSFQQTKPLPK